MLSILTGVVAAILSFVLNRFYLSKLGARGVIYLIPLGEEVFKTGLAYYVGADLITTHLVFGVLEAGFDFLDSNYLAALLAIVTHLLLGILTFYSLLVNNNLIAAIMIAILVHTAWNYLIRRIRQ